jgi:hypothetical protein
MTSATTATAATSTPTSTSLTPSPWPRIRPNFQEIIWVLRAAFFVFQKRTCKLGLSFLSSENASENEGCVFYLPKTHV